MAVNKDFIMGYGAGKAAGGGGGGNIVFKKLKIKNNRPTSASNSIGVYSYSLNVNYNRVEVMNKNITSGNEFEAQYPYSVNPISGNPAAYRFYFSILTNGGDVELQEEENYFTYKGYIDNNATRVLYYTAKSGLPDNYEITFVNAGS